MEERIILDGLTKVQAEAATTELRRWFKEHAFAARLSYGMYNITLYGKASSAAVSKMTLFAQGVVLGMNYIKL